MNYRFFISGLLCILFTLPVWASKATDDDTGRDDRQIFHLYNNIDLVSTIKVQYDKPRIVVKSVFPQLETDDGDIGVKVDSSAPDIDGINEQIDMMVQEAISDFKTYVNENSALQNTMQRKKVRNDFYLDYAASFIRPNRTPIISIRFSMQGMVTGLAHPYHHHFVLNYDLKNDEEIELSDLFKPDSDYLTVLSNYASGKLDKRLTDKELIAKGTAPLEENYKNWNIKANGLLITFDEAQVGPSYLGAQTVLIPFAILSEVLLPESPIGKCAIKKKRCGADLLLTGGFIDEADNSRAIDTRHRRLNPILSQR